MKEVSCPKSTKAFTNERPQSFILSLAPPFIINHPKIVNCCNFLFISSFVDAFGGELSCKRAARL